MAGRVGALLAANKEKRISRISQITTERAQSELQDEQRRALWSPVRKYVYGVIKTTPFEGLCTSVILANLCLVILETDDQATGEESPAWVEAGTSLCMIFYVLELVAKLYCYQLDFFYDAWNNLDLAIVSLDLCLLFIGLVLDNLPSVSVLRIFRLARLARSVKALKEFHELNSLLRSFVGALKALFWGMTMVAMALLIWSILAVQLLHPINERVAKKNPLDYSGCERCQRSFASVWDAALTLWKLLIAGDSWGAVCEPIIEEAPWTCVFFFFALVTVSLILLNLILAVIVEAGTATAAANEHKCAMAQQEAISRAEEKLIDLCRGLDSDGSGSLSITEFMAGYHSNNEFKECLQLMSITDADMSMLFAICDEDDSGEVDYQEFVDHIRRIKHSGQQMVLHYITQIRHMIHHDKKLHELPVFDLQKSHLRKHQAEETGGASSLGSLGASESSKNEEIKTGKDTSDKAIAVVSPILRGSASATPLEENVVRPAPANSSDIVEVAEAVVVDRFGDDKMNMLMRMNEDLVSAMTDVAQESKAQSQLLKTLLEDSLAQHKPAGSPQSLPPAVEPKFNNGDPSSSYRGACCRPWDQAVLLTENNSVAPRSGPTVPTASFAPPPSCCTRAV